MGQAATGSELSSRPEFSYDVKNPPWKEGGKPHENLLKSVHF